MQWSRSTLGNIDEKVGRLENELLELQDFRESRELVDVALAKMATLQVCLRK